MEPNSEREIKQTQYKPKPTQEKMEDIRSNPMEGVRSNPMEGVRSNPMEAARSNPMEGNGSLPMPLGLLPLPEGMRHIPMGGFRGNPMEGFRSNPMEGIRGNPMEGIRSNPMEGIRSNPMEGIRSNPMEGIRSNPMEAIRSNPTDSMNAQSFKREVEDIPEYETNKDEKSVKMEKPGNNFENAGNKDLDTTAENDPKEMPESVEIGMKIGNDEKETLVRAKIESFDNEKTAENDPDQENKQVEPVDINYDEMEMSENEMEYEYDNSYTNGEGHINPWFVNSVEDFLYYNCPECNVKTQSRERFLKHARKNHPMAKEAKHIFGKKKKIKNEYEEDFIDDDSADEEYDEFDESLYYPTVEYGNESDSASADDAGEAKPNSEAKFKCGVCEKSFGRREHLKRHTKSVHERVRFNCNFCEMTFSRKDRLRMHAAKVHGHLEQIPNALGQQNYIDGVKVKQEQGVQVKQEPLDENEMNMFQGNLKQQIKQEMMFNQNIKTEPQKCFKCGQCGKEFSRRYRLTSHIANIHEKQRKCKHCEEIFTSKETLKAHVKQTHPRSQNEVLEIHTCPQCGKQFKRSWHLREHIEGIHEGKRVNCEYCGMSFTQSSSLRSHIKHVHINDRAKNFSCEQCGKSFMSKIYLKLHIESIHEGIKKFICTICAHPFVTKAAMEIHIKCVHNKIKDEVCDLCGRAFGTAKELKIHKRTVHEGIKPVRPYKNVKCSFCDKVYGRTSHLKRHITTAHSGLLSEAGSNFPNIPRPSGLLSEGASHSAFPNLPRPSGLLSEGRPAFPTLPRPVFK